MERVAECREGKAGGCVTGRRDREYRRWRKRRPRRGGLSDRAWPGSCFVLFRVFAGSIVGCLGMDGRGACSKIGSVPVWRRSRVGTSLGRVVWCHLLPVLCVCSDRGDVSMLFVREGQLWGKQGLENGNATVRVK